MTLCGVVVMLVLVWVHARHPSLLYSPESASTSNKNRDSIFWLPSQPATDGRKGRPQQQTRSEKKKRPSTSSLATATAAKNATASTSSTTTTAVMRNNENGTALALLYPPGLLGGYRNQVLRFTSFCRYAYQEGIPALFLPSLWWTTIVTTTTSAADESSTNGTTTNDTHTSPSTSTLHHQQPIPMEWIFDIDIWNKVAANASSLLPRLIHQLPNTDCWQEFDGKPESTAVLSPKNDTDSIPPPLSLLQQAVLEQGALEPIANVTREWVTTLSADSKNNPRKIDYLPSVQHCRRPIVYGGGKSFGRLWNDMTEHRKEHERKAAENGTDTIDQLEQSVLQALHLNRSWKQVAQTCIGQHHSSRKQQQNPGPYMALHARVEVEMMMHICGQDMNWNLTSIFQDIVDYFFHDDSQSGQGMKASLGDSNRTLHSERSRHVTALFVAVSRRGMLPAKYRDRPSPIQRYASENVRTLDRHVLHDVPLVTIENKGDDTNISVPVTVFECGESFVHQYYQQHPDVPDHGSLLQSAMNFDIAVEAAVFVGVRGSSYSTDVWTTRYYMGKGDSNYEYTRHDGIQPMGNRGLPPPHTNCKKKKK